MIITFDKGQFTVTNDADKSVRIGLDGTIISYTGRTVKRMPNGFRRDDIDDAAQSLCGIESLLYNLCYGAYHDYEVAAKVERLWNANTLHKCRSVREACNGYGSLGMAWPIFNTLTFKQLLKTIREYEETVNSYYFSEFVEWYYSYKFFNEANVQELVRHYPLSELKDMYYNYSNDWPKIAKMLSDDDIYDMYCIFGSFYDIKRIIKEILKLTKELNIKCPTKNILHAYANLKREAENARDRRKSETLAANQNPKWAYEDDNFVVIVPTTMQELVDEGQAQHNCVGDFWTNAYGNNLAKGKQERGVVFIRRADSPDASYITCDFDINTKQIHQFLGTCNQEVRDSNAKAFRHEYQEYLFTL